MIRIKNRHKLALLATASTLCIAPTMVQAQDTEDTIVITGSFIKKKNQADLPSPLQTIGAGDIDATGAQSIADLTQTLTINTGAENNPDAFTQNATVGTANINLRGLGIGSTLVLLNGQRQVLSGAPNNGGVSFVDTNSLVPTIAIDRVEILKDGASALYGSDAVAGVVNFITKDGYDGFKLSGDYVNVEGTGDSDEVNVQALWGKSFDRGSILAALSYADRSELTTADRRLSRPQDDTSALGNPGAFFLTAPLGPVPAGTPLFDPGCAAAGGFPLPASAAAAPLLPQGVGFCGFDFGDFFSLIPEEEKLNGIIRAEFDISDTLTWKGEFGFADNEASRGNSPSFPVLTLNSTVIPGAAFGPLANPNNIFPGDPTLIFFGRISGNGGTVSPTTTESETFRFSTSIGGDIGTGAWEVSATVANNDFVVSTPDTVSDRFQCSLSGFISVPGVPGLTTGTDCTAANENLTLGGATLPSVGTFFNPFSTSFSTSPNDPALLAYLQSTQERSYESELRTVQAFVSQEVFQLPAGPVSIAVGAQYRENELSQTVDQLSLNDAFGFLVGGRNFSGSQDVFAAFGEASIPLSDWADLQLALRYEDYGDEIGDTIDPKIALLLRPTDQLSLRGSFSTSFRAPSVFQQFGESTTLQQIVDPLNSVAFAAVRTLAPQGSARDLQPEESEAFNLGASWQPVNGLQFDLDYWSFDFENVIIQTTPQAIVNANPMDPNIIRAPSINGDGTILQVNNDFVNASSVETSGIDFKVAWAIDSQYGVFQPSIEGTYITEYDLVDPQAGSVDGAGNRNFTNFGTSTPELRYNAGLSWVNGAHSANLFVRHIDSYTDDQNAGIEVDDHTTVDWRYNLDIAEYLQRDKEVSIHIGMTNAFDQDPPQVFTNGGFDSKVHDPRGRLLYIGADLEF